MVKYRNKYIQKYYRLLTYSKKQIRRKVKKKFMTPEEFLGIYELTIYAKSKEDYEFVIQLIESSKTYKHYKNNTVIARAALLDRTLQEHMKVLREQNLNSGGRQRLMIVLEWLFSHTVHANSLNSVTFR